MLISRETHEFGNPAPGGHQLRPESGWKLIVKGGSNRLLALCSIYLLKEQMKQKAKLLLQPAYHWFPMVH